MVAPDSTLAGLLALVAVSPRTPGSHSKISMTTKLGGVTAMALPFQKSTVQLRLACNQ